LRGVVAGPSEGTYREVPGPSEGTYRCGEPDLVVVAEGRELFVHKTVLTEASSFFRELLKTDPKCTRINANNARYDSMVLALRTCYPPQPKHIFNTIIEYSTILSAWEIGVHFALSKLANEAVPLLLLGIDRGNVVSVLRACLKHPRDAGAVKLREACMAFLPPQDEQRAEWVQLVARYPQLQPFDNTEPRHRFLSTRRLRGE